MVLSTGDKETLPEPQVSSDSDASQDEGRSYEALDLIIKTEPLSPMSTDEEIMDPFFDEAEQPDAGSLPENETAEVVLDEEKMEEQTNQASAQIEKSSSLSSTCQQAKVGNVETDWIHSPDLKAIPPNDVGGEASAERPKFHGLEAVDQPKKKTFTAKDENAEKDFPLPPNLDNLEDDDAFIAFCEGIISRGLNVYFPPCGRVKNSPLLEESLNLKDSGIHKKSDESDGNGSHTTSNESSAEEQKSGSENGPEVIQLEKSPTQHQTDAVREDVEPSERNAASAGSSSSNPKRKGGVQRTRRAAVVATQDEVEEESWRYRTRSGVKRLKQD